MAEHHGELAFAFPERADWTLPTVLARQAQRFGPKTFLQFEDGETVSYADADARSNQVARTLAAAGVGRGDRVVVLLPNSVDYVLLWFGLTKVGAIMVPINTSYREEFLSRPVNSSRARVLITDATLLAHVAEVSAALPELVDVYLVGDVPPEPTSVGGAAVSGLARFASADGSPLVAPVTHHDPGLVLLTGGTTGPSKSILMPHGQCYFFAEEFANLMRITSEDVLVSSYPFFHASGLIFGLYQILTRGATIVLYERFSASQWLERNRRHGATVAQFIGATMDFVYQQPPTPEDHDNRITRIIAFPTAWNILDEFSARFGVHRFVESYGTSETSIAMMVPWDEPRPRGACGKLVADWFDVRIVDPETDEPVPVGEIGELLVRPKEPWTMCLGYDGDPTNTLRVMRNLWWHTGDAMRVDADGWYYFHDRTNDALRVRGENVSSYEIEQAILAHPRVKACAAVSVAAAFEAGEHEVKACVVLDSAEPFDLPEFIAFCDRTMPWFAVPRYVEVLDVIPENDHGKIRRAELRARGVTPDTLDRLAAGVLLEKERQRAAEREVGP